MLLIGGLAAGCSSDVTRFQDSILTGSSRLDGQVAPVQQAYPGDTASLDQTYTGSVNRGAVRPLNVMQRSNLIPRPQTDVSTGSMIASQPAQTAYPSAPRQTYASAGASTVTSGGALPPVSGVDATVTGTTAAAKPAVEQAMPIRTAKAEPRQVAPASQNAIVVSDAEGGWTRAGGTQISIKQGETVYNLSRRFGVPAKAIMKANGLSDATALAAGQKVVIPTYVHSADAPVSAPDANPNVADARSTTGTRYDLPANKVPVPSETPQERVAVLPQQPKLREQPVAGQTASADAQNKAAGSGQYVVVSGDTLNGISRRHGVTTEALKQANGLSDGLIRIGQKLTIPAAGAQSVQVAAAPKTDPAPTGSVVKADPEPSAVKAYTPPQKAEKVIQASLDSGAVAPDSTGISRMRWPVRGRVISAYGSSGGNKNDGIDIAVPEGTPVKAAENGVVIYAGNGLKEFGNTVLVRHEDGLVTVYGHASEITVERGQKVRRGEEIAKAGMSGSADMPKLHFEVRKDSAPVDPVSFLE